ncbi:putative 1,2-phenylacetyl-CoA epoxidase, subunit D [Austwickia sp. TVS 96-490-7B]|uniref:1,2-phenylacetyl-CoA epoxidase subunit PaaD n=1 Tax=Austwickia sp. TVS 96-490-7B TaxID=2830843 RepID=UPI001DC4F1C7|nr:putative 1,2-phenylacetyl-CoA epoxidase, subunit D [Austwickia sp. TVS 96-490-7B]
MSGHVDLDEARAWDLAAAVPDPEIPVLTIADLGVLRSVRVDSRLVDGVLRRTAFVQVTPTYSGCPAMETFRRDVVAALLAGGFDDAQVELVLSPAWTTDWMTQAGRDRLAAYGIAPPVGGSAAVRTEPGVPRSLALSVRCPHCGSLRTVEKARFASTSCKALYSCRDCLEPFDYFKVL